MDVDRLRVIVYILIAIALGPLLISIPSQLIRPARKVEAKFSEKSLSLMVEERGEGKLGNGELAESPKAILLSLPLLWLLDLGVALSVYFIAKRLSPTAL